MPNLPRKLKKDAIEEALFEIRFESAESLSVPELLVGRLSQAKSWSGFLQIRTPFADFPAAFRAQDPNLKFMPIVELASKPKKEIVKIGPNVISYHSIGGYPGWGEFQKPLHELIDHCLKTSSDFSVERLGFRYVNLLKEEDHHIHGISDLAVEVVVGGNALEGPRNLSFFADNGDDHRALVRIGTPEFVQVAEPKKYTVAVDVDVQSRKAKRILSANEIKQWVDRAHDLEKEQFFRLFPPAVLEPLVEA